MNFYYILKTVFLQKVSRSNNLIFLKSKIRRIVILLFGGKETYNICYFFFPSILFNSLSVSIYAFSADLIVWSICFPIVSATSFFKPFIVHRKALLDIFIQPFCCPLTKLRSNTRTIQIHQLSLSKQCCNVCLFILFYKQIQILCKSECSVSLLI